MKENAMKKALAILRNGGVVVFPTDTVYGVGCRFDDQKAIERIYKIKGTSKTQSFPVLVSNVSQVAKFAIINGTAKKLIKKYWPGGLTIIMESKSGNKKLGFRMPDSKIIRYLTDRVGPIVGTSANFHGARTPTAYEELDPQIIRLVDYVIEGECEKGIESTVVDSTTNPPKINRPGAVKI